MSVQYLVDYENTHEPGLAGMEYIQSEDSVYIFHTAINDRISLGRLDGVRGWVSVTRVPPGNQSLDKHLISFLGYLIGREEEGQHEEAAYAIISKDKGYQNIADFWNSHCQTKRKVYCAETITDAYEESRPLLYEEAKPEEYTENEIAVREHILYYMERNGWQGPQNQIKAEAMQLCAWLSTSGEYKKERHRTGKKPMRYLKEECGDIIQIRREGWTDYAYLNPSALYENGEAEEKNDPLSAEDSMAQPEDTPEQPADQDPETETVRAGESNETEFSIQETEEPQPECSASNIDNPTVKPEAAPEPKPAEQEPDPLQSLRNGIEIFIRDRITKKGEEAFPCRASEIRDVLHGIRAYREQLKASGEKPIAFIRNHFPETIQLRREKGVWYAEPPAKIEDDTKRKKKGKKDSFQQEAYDNIHNLILTSGFMDPEAERITECYLSASRTENTKAAYYSQLWNVFGTKLGSNYYRKTKKLLLM